MISILAAAALALSLLVACTGQDPQQDPSAGPSSQVSGEPSETPLAPPIQEPSEEPSEIPPEPSAPTVPHPPSPTPASSPTPALEPSMELNRNEIVFTAPDYTFQLTARFSNGARSAGVVWTSSDEGVAQVNSSGLVTAVAPGTATITAKSEDGLVASCIVRCRWDEGSEQPSAVDLQAFADQILLQYAFPTAQPAQTEAIDRSYPGLTMIGAQQRLVYLCQEPQNNQELVLLELTNQGDIEAAKAILQARVNTMSGGGAWFPEAMEAWADNNRIVSSGSCILLVVHPQADAVVEQFNALFS